MCHLMHLVNLIKANNMLFHPQHYLSTDLINNRQTSPASLVFVVGADDDDD